MKKHTLVAFVALTLGLVTVTGCKKEEKTTTACISTTASTFNTGQAVAFSSCSKEAASFLWTFGDGSTASALENPTHTYTESGTYNVSLATTGTSGNATATKTITIEHSADNYVGTYSTTETCTGGTDSYISSVTKASATSVIINNFYGSGWTVTATIANGVLTIPSQTVGGSSGSGTVTAVGTGSLSSTASTFSYNVTLTAGTDTETCTVTGIRQ